MDRWSIGSTIPFLAMVFLGLGCRSASGQLVTPPGDKPAATVVVASPPEPRETYLPINPDQPRPSDHGYLPDLPYESLIVRDAGGRLIPVRGDPHVLALSRNPLLDDSSVQRFQAAIAERRLRVDRLVIDNLDLVQRALDGEIARADLSDRESIAAVVAIVQPFMEIGHLTNDLNAQQLLTDQQYGFNWKIVREYEQAMQMQVMSDANANPDGPSEMTAATRLIGKNFLLEPLEEFENMLREAAGRIDQAMAGIELSATTTGLAVPLRERIREQRQREAGIAAMRELFALMNLDQKRMLLENVVATR